MWDSTYVRYSGSFAIGFPARFTSRRCRNCRRYFTSANVDTAFRPARRGREGGRCISVEYGVWIHKEL